jgi:hypothetical protein
MTVQRTAEAHTLDAQGEFLHCDLNERIGIALGERDGRNGSENRGQADDRRP